MESFIPIEKSIDLQVQSGTFCSAYIKNEFVESLSRGL